MLFNFFKKKDPIQETVDSMLKEKTVEEWINPPVPVDLSEAEHKLAQVRAVYQLDIEDILFAMASYILDEGENDPYKKQRAEVCAREFMDALNTDETSEWWEAFRGKDQLNFIKESLTSPHAGDCVAYPCSCMRCYAEEFYKLQPTANWPKAVGHRLATLFNMQKKK